MHIKKRSKEANRNLPIGVGKYFGFKYKCRF